LRFEIGDYVTRRSYNSDIIFKIEKLHEDKVILRGYKLRLMADASPDDLVKVNKNDTNSLRRNLLHESYEYLQRQKRNLIINGNMIRNKEMDNCYRKKPGRVLHIDGDRDYLKISLQNYENLQIQAKGYYMREKNIASKIKDYLQVFKPDILVITGHDGYVENSKYHTSDYFIEAVKKARYYENNLDDLIIFAGACQSYYKKLINSGANFASSPEGKLIHFLDPVMVVEKIANTSIKEVISVKDIIKTTITGKGGIGGIETRGKLRLCYP